MSTTVLRGWSELRSQVATSLALRLPHGRARKRRRGTRHDNCRCVSPMPPAAGMLDPILTAIIVAKPGLSATVRYTNLPSTSGGIFWHGRHFPCSRPCPMTSKSPLLSLSGHSSKWGVLDHSVSSLMLICGLWGRLRFVCRFGQRPTHFGENFCLGMCGTGRREETKRMLCAGNVELNTRQT